MSNIEILDFKECVVDSPSFREKLFLHEKEIENHIKVFNDINNSIKKVFRTMQDCSSAFEELADNLMKFTANEDASLSEMYNIPSETEDEKMIRCSVKMFSDMINKIEAMKKMHMFGATKETVMNELRQLGDDCLSLSKQNIKEFRKATIAFYSKLEKYSAIKYKPDAEYDTVDADFQVDRREFVQKALDHVMMIEDTEAKKTTKLAHTLGLMVNMLKTYHHEAFDHIKDTLNKIGEIEDCVERTLASYCSITTDTTRLMIQVRNRPIEHVQPDPEGINDICRQGYLMVLTKKPLVSDNWTRKYCIYEKNSKKLQLIQVNQIGVSPSNKQIEDYQVISCEGKLLNNAERRFCFELKVSNQSTPLTLQALSKEDLKQWLLIMDGKEPVYVKPCTHGNSQESKCSLNEKATKLLSIYLAEIEKRGMDLEGLYRLGGRKTEIDGLVQKMISQVNNQSSDSVSVEDLEAVDIKSLTSAVKAFIGSFKIPLATYKLYDEFISAGNLPENADRYNALLIVVRKLPPEHFQMFALIMKHLHKVSLHEQENKMSAANLATCLSPNIFRSKDENVTNASIKKSKFATEALVIMIQRPNDLFSSSNLCKNIALNKSVRLTKEEKNQRQATVERSRAMSVGNFKSEDNSTRAQLDNIHESNSGEVDNFERTTERRMSDTSLPLSDKGYSMEESIVMLRSLVEQFKSLTSMSDLKSMSDVAKQLDQLFYDCPNYQREHGDTLMALEFPDLVIKAMRRLNNMGVSKTDDIWYSTFYCYEICRKYSNISFEFASALCQQGLASLLILNIGHKAYLEKLSSDSINFLIKSSLDIIRNMCRYPGNCTHFRADAVKKSLRNLTKVDKDAIKVVATLCLVLIVSESDTCLLCPDSGGEDFLSHIMTYIREARASDRKKVMGYRSYELLQGIRSATSVEKERQHFIDIGGLDLLKEVFEDRRNATNEELLECLEILCNISNSEQLVGKLVRAGITSSIIQPFIVSVNSLVKSAAQDYLWRLEMNENICSEIVSMDPANQSTVYICHSSINKQTVLKLKGRLQETSLVKIIDSENRFSVASVKKTIEKCAIVILCLSEAFKSQPRCQLEVEYCDCLSKRVVPVLIQQKYRPDGWLQRFLDREITLFNLSNKVDFDSSWETLLSTITGHLKDVKKDIESSAVNSVSPLPIIRTRGTDADKCIGHWFEQNGLGHLKARLDWLDPYLLESLRAMKTHASEYFYYTLEKQMKLELIDILKFATAIDNF